MATITSSADGNWSAAGTWSGGVPPTTGDVADIDHNVTVDMNTTVDGIDLSATSTLTIAAGVSLSGMNQSVIDANGCAIYMEAGASLRFNSASNLHLGRYTKFTARGSSGSLCTVDNAGAGGIACETDVLGVWDCEWLDLHGFVGVWTWRSASVFKNCDFEGADSNSSFATNLPYYWISFIGCYYSSAKWFVCDQGPIYVENCIFGEDRDGNSQANSAGDIRNTTNAPVGAFRWRNVRLLSPTQFQAMCDGTIFYIDNFGCALGDGNPGTQLVKSRYWSWERSTSAAKSGTYGVRVTPESGIGDTPYYRAEVEVCVPIESGQDVSVSVYGRQHNLSTDAGKVVIDPECAWFDTPVEIQPSQTADTWVEFSGSTSGGARGTGQKGMCRIVMHVYEYASGSYFDWADLEATAS